MTRPLRLEYPGAIYHVTTRGNDRRRIFKDDDDCKVFLERLDQTVSRFDWILYAYCLMGNHYHLVVETPDANLSRGMAQVNSAYAQAFNKRYGLVGHLFQSRFKSLVVQRETYLLTVLRYTVLNPVRAEMCERPEDYRYSSYVETLRARDDTSLINRKVVLAHFGRDLNSARDSYQEFVVSGIDADSIHEEVRAQVFLGDDRFIDDHTIDLNDEKLGEISSVARPDPRPPLEHLVTDFADRDAVYYAYREWGYNMRELGWYIGKHYSTVSRMIREYEAGNSSTCGMQQRKT